MKVPIRLYGDPALRKHCEPVKEITPEIQQLIENLLETTEDGWGMAAPQLGYGWRVFVCCFPIFGPDGKRTGDTDLRVWINPKLSDPSPEMWTHGESCFSLPGLYVDVARPHAITIEAMDEKGNPVKERLEGWPARIVMHENDHLNGVLTIDRIPAKERRVLDAQLRALKEKSKKLGGK